MADDQGAMVGEDTEVAAAAVLDHSMISEAGGGHWTCLEGSRSAVVVRALAFVLDS